MGFKGCLNILFIEGTVKKIFCNNNGSSTVTEKSYCDNRFRI